MRAGPVKPLRTGRVLLLMQMSFDVTMTLLKTSLTEYVEEKMLFCHIRAIGDCQPGFFGCVFSFCVVVKEDRRDKAI